MKLLENWKAPTPKKWKRVMYTSMTLAAAAVVFLNSERIGSALVPNFHFKLFRWAELMWTYIMLAGTASAAVSKFQKENPPEKEEE